MPVFDTFAVQAPNTSDTTRAFALKQEALSNLMKPLMGFQDLAKTITGAQQSQEAAEAQAVIRAAMAGGNSVADMRQRGLQASKLIDPRIWANAQGDKLVDKEIDRYITDSTDRRNWSADRRAWMKAFGDFALQESQGRHYDALANSVAGNEQRTGYTFFTDNILQPKLSDAIAKTIMADEPLTFESILGHLQQDFPEFFTMAKDYPGLYNNLQALAKAHGVTAPVGNAGLLGGTFTSNSKPVTLDDVNKFWENPMFKFKQKFARETAEYNGKNYFISRDGAGNETINVDGKTIAVPKGARRGVGVDEKEFNLSTPTGVQAYQNEMLRITDEVAKGLPFLSMDPNKGTALEALLDRTVGKDDKNASYRNKVREELMPYYNEMLKNGHNDQTATALLWRHYDPTTTLGGFFTNDNVHSRDLKNDPEYKNATRLKDAITRIRTLQNIAKTNPALQQLIDLRKAGNLLAAHIAANPQLNPTLISSMLGGHLKSLIPLTANMTGLQASAQQLSDVSQLAIQTAADQSRLRSQDQNNINKAIAAGVNVIGDAKNMNNGGTISTFGTYSPPPAADDPAAAAQTALAKSVISQYDKNQKEKTKTSPQDWAKILGVKPSEIRSSAGKIRAIVIRELEAQGYPSAEIGYRANDIVTAIENSTNYKPNNSRYRYPKSR